MALRWGLGPVFAFEWRLTARRWQGYAGRSAFVLVLLAALFVVWSVEIAGKPLQTIRSQTTVAETFFYTIIGTQLCLVLLAAPATAAGSICTDKSRGTLAHVLVTDLSDSEIVLGKLAARLLPVFGLVGCTIPVMFLTGLLGGIDLEALFGAFLVTLGVSLVGCTLALTLSVWGNKTHEVLIATYLFLAGWVMAYPTCSMLLRLLSGTMWLATPVTWFAGADWFGKANPFWLAFAPYAQPGSVRGSDFVGFLAGTLFVSLGLIAVSVWRIRAVYVRQAGRQPRPRRRLLGRGPVAALFDRLPGPSLDGNPVLWREWHRSRPSRWSRVVWLIYGVGATLFSLLAIAVTVGSGSWMRGELAVMVNAFQVSIGLLLLSVAAPSALAEERARGSLDVLLATPLSTRSIVWGKWWGAYRKVTLLSVLPGLVTLSLAIKQQQRLLAVCMVVGLVLAYGAAITSLGLALATWVTRLGRAVAVNVAAYVLVTVGWFFFILALLHNNNSLGPGLASGSPFFGVAYQTVGAIELRPIREWSECVGWGVIWLVAYAAGAVVLLLATLATFDRCLGRVPDGAAPVYLRPAPRPILLQHAPADASLALPAAPITDPIRPV